MLVPAATAPENNLAFGERSLSTTGLSFQVLVGVGIAIILGYIRPFHRHCHEAARRRPFIRLITMIITLVIFLHGWSPGLPAWRT